MRPRLIIETPEGISDVHHLQPDQVTSLGRNRNNTVVLVDKHASRWHAEIVLEEGRWVLRDRDTMNGTRVNSKLVREPVELTNGDEIRIGDTRLRFAFDPSDVDTAERPKLTLTPAPPTPPLADV